MCVIKVYTNSDDLYEYIQATDTLNFKKEKKKIFFYQIKGMNI